MNTNSLINLINSNNTVNSFEPINSIQIANGLCSGISYWLILLRFMKIPNIRVLWTLLKSLLLIPLPLKFVCWHFLAATQTYFTLKTFKDHIRLKYVNFHISLKFIKQNCFIKLSDLPLSQFLRFLKSESFQSSRIQKSLPWTPKLLGQVIFVK